MGRWLQATNTSRGRPLATSGRRAANPWTRFVGLLGRGRLATGEGLQLVPCSSVHTWFMRFPIDVVYLDRSDRVIKVVLALRPFRFSWGRGAHSALELPPGTVAATGTAVGDTITFEPGSAVGVADPGTDAGRDA